MLNDDMLDALNENGTSGGMVFILSLVTCGIYGLYWIYQMGQRVDRLGQMNGKNTNNTGLMYLLISLFGFSIVIYAIIQNELNHYYREVPPTYYQ